MARQAAFWFSSGLKRLVRRAFDFLGGKHSPCCLKGLVMVLSEIIEWPISGHAHSGELEEHERWGSDDLEAHIRKWTAARQHERHLNRFVQRSGFSFSGDIMEIGAGSCWLSSIVSRSPQVKTIHAVEFSRRRLETWSPVCMKIFGADASKIIRVRGDFNNLQVGGNSMDAVIADAVLHHATDLPFLLKELARVLKPGGSLIAFREATKAHFRSVPQYFRNIEYENIYKKSEYLDMLRAAGFEARAVPGWNGDSWKAKVKDVFPFSALNNYFWASYTFWGVKK